MKTSYLLTTLLLGSLRALAAHADAGPTDQLLSLSLEELMATKVKISTRAEQTLTKAPSVVSIITAEDIKATGATNLIDVLQAVPGVYIRENLFGFKPFITFRGASSAQTLLMINGLPMKDLVWTPGIFWKGLPTSAIERIEIIRGPGSALFGSDASAGVINVITKTAGKIDRSEAGLRTGGFGTHSAWLQYGGEWNGFDVNFTADATDTDGHAPFISRDKLGVAGHIPYGWNGGDFRFSMGGGNWRLNADYMAHRDVQTGLTGGAILDSRTRGKDSRYNVDLFYDNPAFAKDWGINAELRYVDLKYDSGEGFQEEPPSAAFPAGKLNRQRSAERRASFEGSGLYAGFRQHAIRMGGGYVAQDLYLVEQFVNFLSPTGVALPAGGPLINLSDTPYVFQPEKARKISYLFVQDVWTLAEDWELTAGARHDHYSDFGGTLNPRLAVVWQSTEKLTTKLMYGRAFRAPSYLELYGNTAANIGNPNLKPERTQTLDVAFSYTASKDLKLGVDLYRFLQYDVIGSLPSQPYRNIGNLAARGIELEAAWQAASVLRVSGNVGVRSEDFSAVRNFNVPKRKAYLRADWALLPQWNWDVQANWIGQHILAPTARVSAPSAYTLVDTTLRYSSDRHWEFAASIRNLFNADAREYVSASIPDNLQLPRRNLYAEARYKF